MEDIIKEKLLNKSVAPVSIEGTKTILHQMKKCVCKIYINGIKGTGFITKIPHNNELLKVLITNNHIINEDIIISQSIINLSFKNDIIKKTIQINPNRKCYTNPFLDVTIIQILENDDINYYLELDDEILNSINLGMDIILSNAKNMYINTSIYILNYLKGENIVVSYGLLTDINENGIIHKCDTDYGSSGAPILSLSSNKLIGIHFGSSIKYEYNRGILLIYAIIGFNEYYFNINQIIAQDQFKNQFTKMKILEEYDFIKKDPLKALGIDIEIPDHNKRKKVLLIRLSHNKFCGQRVIYGSK